MNTPRTQPYQPPMLHVVRFRSERGYVGSNDFSLLGLLKGGIDEGDSIEGERKNGGFWGGGDGDTWF